MSSRPYDALLLDLDGTLLTEEGRVRDRVRTSLDSLRERGVLVLVVTGRSELGAQAVLDELGLDEPTVVYNGAGLWCPRTRRLLEERVLSDRTTARTLDLARRQGYLTLLQQAGVKFVSEPRNEAQFRAMRGLEGVRFCRGWDLPDERVIRITLFSEEHRSSGEFCAELEREIDQPIYTTHFPLHALATHRQSELLVVDVHPPCLGKAEAFRVLEERWGIAPERVVAVGDATNDIPMFERAGLAVAMQGSMAEALAAADRVIGSNDSDAIAELVEELFGAEFAPQRQPFIGPSSTTQPTQHSG